MNTNQTLSIRMRQVINVFNKDLRLFIFTPTVYVCLALFLFLSNYLGFIVGKFFTLDNASLSQFFYWHPWLYAFFIPAICMRLWSEEYRQNTLELLLTMGFSTWELVVGKFLAAWLVMIAGLLLSFPLVITLSILGPPDYGVIISGYLGSVLVCGTFIAISLAAASITRNQFISYVIGAAACSFILMLGAEASLNSFIRMFPNIEGFTSWLNSLSIHYHFTQFKLGMIPLASVVFFISSIAIGLYFAQRLIVLTKK